MYVRRDRAFAWRDDSSTESVTPPPRPSAPPPLTIWAKLPWKGRLGLYVAVRLKAEELEVAIAGAPRPTWVPAHRALTEFEAERWAKTGFA